MNSFLDIFSNKSAQDKASEQAAVLNRDLARMEEGYGATYANHLSQSKRGSSSTLSSSPSNSETEHHDNLNACSNKPWPFPSNVSDIESIFSSVRSLEEFEEVKETNESEAYRNSTSLQRAMPERLFALTITLILEIPVLMMVSGGSDALCALIGPFEQWLQRG